jgi:PAS domain S-box-containing protein
MYGAVADIVFYIGVEPEHRYRFLSVNPAFLKATGLPEHAVVGRLVSEVVPEPSRAVVQGNYDRAIRERKVVTWDEMSTYPAGVRYGEVSVTPIFDADGQCTNLLGTVHDVTERRLAQERMAEQAALLDKAKDAILVRDLNGVVRHWNLGAERLYGWSREEAIGRNVRQLLYRDPTAFENGQRQAIETGEWSGELTQYTRDGRALTVEGRWTLLSDPDGQPKSILAINSDVTERKLLEAQIVRAQRLESLGTLAGGIAHDFNNILTAIVGNLDFARRTITTAHPAQEALAEAERASTLAAQLVQRILAFSRQQEPRRAPVRLPQLVQETLKLLRSAVPSQVIETRFADDVPEILADPTQIQQVIMNLGTNAAYAMRRRNGVLRVQLDRATLTRRLIAGTSELAEGDYARLIVSDSGAGIDGPTLERIFDPFFTTKPEGEGTGLGLSVVHGIVKNHGGGIVVESTPGRGTTFSVYFPAEETRPGGSVAADAQAEARGG